MTHSPMAGYRRRPTALSVLAVVFALVPVLSWASWYLPVLVSGGTASALDVLVGNFGTAAHGPWGAAHAVLAGLLWVLFWVVAWGIWKVTRWGLTLCIVAAVANSLFSMVLYGVSQGPQGVVERVVVDPLQWGVLVNLVFFVPVLLILQRDLAAPFFNPKLKWWEQHPRVRATLSIEAALSGTTRTYQSFDISASGMFLVLDADEVAAHQVPREPFAARIHLEDAGAVVDVVCTVVWVSTGSGRAAPGYGVTFRYADGRQKKVLAAYLRDRLRQGHALERI